MKLAILAALGAALVVAGLAACASPTESAAARHERVQAAIIAEARHELGDVASKGTVERDGFAGVLADDAIRLCGTAREVPYLSSVGDDLRPIMSVAMRTACAPGYGH